MNRQQGDAAAEPADELLQTEAAAAAAAEAAHRNGSMRRLRRPQRRLQRRPQKRLRHDCEVVAEALLPADGARWKQQRRKSRHGWRRRRRMQTSWS